MLMHAWEETREGAAATATMRCEKKTEIGVIGYEECIEKCAGAQKRCRSE